MAIDLGYDESGANDTLLVTVQMGTVSAAKKLKREWKQALREANNLEYFHANEFDDQSTGVFSKARLSRDRRASLLRDLSRMSRQHLLAVTAKATKSLYKQKTTNDFRSRWGTEYTFAIQMLVLVGYLYAEVTKSSPEFNVLIEEGHANASQALAAIKSAKEMGIQLKDVKDTGDVVKLQILTEGLGLKKDYPILQAADMAAYAEWQKINGGDLTIYDALHPADTIYFEPEFVDLDIDLVDIVKSGADEWIKRRKEFGRKKAKEIEQRAKQ